MCNFGVIVKRRTILKTLAFFVSLWSLYYIMQTGVVTADQKINTDLTWSKF